jgi:formylmethanofuran dehydrogenase subunit E
MGMQAKTAKQAEMALRAEFLADALDTFFKHRYSDVLTLKEIATSKRSLVSDERVMALHLLEWRTAAGWPQPEIIGALRCADCHKVMADDESSVDEEETICAKCGKEVT